MQSAIVGEDASGSRVTSQHTQRRRRLQGAHDTDDRSEHARLSAAPVRAFRNVFEDTA
jgi:hypothetical protein